MGWCGDGGNEWVWVEKKIKNVPEKVNEGGWVGI